MDTNAQQLEQSSEIWGPHVWATMHSLALRSDNSATDNSDFLLFLQSLETLLPCTKCRKDYTKYLNSNGYPNPKESFLWTVNFHNAVNQKLNKQTFTLEQAKSQWLSDSCSYSCSEKKSEPKSILPYCIVIICLFFLIKMLLV